MKTTDEVISNRKDVKSDSKGINTSADNIFINCEIAKDATKKIDFLILVIETLQINATDSLLLMAKDIGLSDDFSTLFGAGPTTALHQFGSRSGPI